MSDNLTPEERATLDAIEESTDWFVEENARADLVDRVFELVGATIRKRFGLTIDESLDLLSDDRAEAERLI
jgi:hypothetical protein